MNAPSVILCDLQVNWTRIASGGASQRPTESARVRFDGRGIHSKVQAGSRGVPATTALQDRDPERGHFPGAMTERALSSPPESADPPPVISPQSGRQTPKCTLLPKSRGFGMSRCPDDLRACPCPGEGSRHSGGVPVHVCGHENSIDIAAAFFGRARVLDPWSSMEVGTGASLHSGCWDGAEQVSGLRNRRDARRRPPHVSALVSPINTLLQDLPPLVIGAPPHFPTGVTVHPRSRQRRRTQFR